ncbi:ATPase [Paraoerskovia sediminicola]|uniref:ATPase n=1 Tax=Paraoerskovia sediminicola TaxID=1138587 RepID=A0ABN6XA50_9CELL|nr:SRPBCC family protein [Paraoerskovia sediminicola]BDZ41758.1 ATPase [Paraoerskovia sediminicola]
MSTNPTTVTAPEGLPYIDVVRELDAPVALVYRAFTEPDLVRRWLGPRSLEMELDHYDARSGGSWAYTHRDPEGNGYGFHGSFHSVVENESITQTFEFAGYPGHVSLETVTLEALDGDRTRTRTHAVYQSVEDRDGMVASGMESGLTEGYERMDELLATL